MGIFVEEDDVREFACLIIVRLPRDISERTGGRALVKAVNETRLVAVELLDHRRGRQDEDRQSITITDRWVVHSADGADREVELLEVRSEFVQRARILVSVDDEVLRLGDVP